ncbi:50S ribosomal protein L11 methyltransferase [Actinocorallia sp. API 0066]|uniref:class I SAM-dependent methyltransferase n=1 Tax=Actinocorallia sp. API 0066 TaxID=2896846 RepID=UPI001E470C05|nr:50S ribosomal protein L11 methyltransferase [Actinocorallia sp. API 0066]MCD0450051.1 50S ribosomal protein L11 methyltransferase [Actinocorallia sp. API 0066]
MQPNPPLCKAPEELSFVRAHTRLKPVPLLPEIVLHQADDPYGLWERTEDTGLPYWAFAWTGGLALARYVLDRPELVRGRRVLDFASGSGVVAVAAARAGAREVVAAEVDPYAGAAVLANAEANAVAVTALCADVLDDAEPEAERCDVVLAGDVFYDKAMSRRVEPYLRRRARAGALVLVGDPGRRYLPRGTFTALARYDVPVSRALEDARHKRTTVWQVPG